MDEGGYSQFCPVAKGAEIVAMRWTPLVLRELMCGETSFNDIHRGVPRMSRALLAERLRQLENDGIVVKVPREGADKGHLWKLTDAGEALRDVIEVLGRWGLAYGRQRVTEEDLDSTVLMWALRRRVDREALPPRRIVVRFDLSGVPRSRTGVRLHWLVLERTMVDVCLKDPGHPVDCIVTGAVSALIDVYLGHVSWREATRGALTVEGSRDVTDHLDRWLQLDRIVGRDLPIVPPRTS
jgi:DNA-binding HxlR family transcriptional regulator